MTKNTATDNIDLKAETIRIFKQAARFYRYKETFNKPVDGKEYGYGMLVIECSISLLNINRYINNNDFISREYYDAIYASVEAYYEQVVKCNLLLALFAKEYLKELANFRPK